MRRYVGSCNDWTAVRYQEFFRSDHTKVIASLAPEITIKTVIAAAGAVNAVSTARIVFMTKRVRSALCSHSVAIVRFSPAVSTRVARPRRSCAASRTPSDEELQPRRRSCGRVTARSLSTMIADGIYSSATRRVESIHV